MNNNKKRINHTEKKTKKLEEYSLDWREGITKKIKMRLFVGVWQVKGQKNMVWDGFKGRKNIGFFQVQVQKSKKHGLRWVQRWNKHRFLPSSKVRKTWSAMGSKVEKTSVSFKFKSQKNMVCDGFKGRKNIDFFWIQKLKNIIPSTVGRIIWKKKFVCVCVCVCVCGKVKG
jgi:hypothetical protein